MPRSTRHKSSKHSKDARDYSDSDKERKSSKEEGSGGVRVSGEKRKEYYDSVNGEYYEEYTSSKRRRGKAGESGGDRWSGKDEEKGEGSKKTKVSSSSRRREEGDGEETRKSGGSKHRESSRRESKEFDKDKEREKYRESKSDKLYDGDKSKGLSDKNESKVQDQLRSPGTENHTEKRSRRKRDDHGVGEKHQDNSDDPGDEYIKDGKHRGEKSRDKYRVDKEEDVKQIGDKQREDRPTKDDRRSDEKLLRDESKKKSKLQDVDHGHEPDSELDGYHERERNRDYERESDRNERDREGARDRDYERDRERDRDRGRDRDRRDYEHERYHERDWDRDRSRDRDRDHDRDRTHDREKDRSRDYYHDGRRSKSDRERDNDRDVSRPDDQSGRYKDRREGRKSPDYQDYQEVVMDTRSSRAGADVDVIKSERQPSSSVVQEENGNTSDQITKWVSSREAAELSGGSDRGTRQRVSEKTVKMEDGVLGEFQGSARASPRPMVERSPSSTSHDRRFNNRSGVRRSIEVEETGHKNNLRDFSAPEDERLLVDDTSQTDMSFNNKANQNSSSFPPRPERSGISSPRVGPREDDNRVNTGGRYRRGNDAMTGRGQTQGNVWRGVPSWTAPLPNGFIPFQHVQPHGFQTMMPQYPSPSIFGARPSMEMNHSGIPYHIPDAERFSGPMRPLGWQNMMDTPGSSHMHGFFGDMSNSVFRGEANMYGGSEWDHNRQMHSRGWESGADEWKNRNGDASMEVSSRSAKDDNSAQVADGESPGGQTSHSENNRAKSVEAGSNLTSPAKELDARSPKIKVEVAAEDPITETDKSERIRRHYLSKLDVSVELADPELCKCISLLMDGERQPIDDGAAVFVNLKEGGKRVRKSNGTSLASLSLFSSQNSSAFQIAMNLYKEQRFEMKGLPNVETHRPPQASPSSLVKVDNNDDMTDVIKGNSSIETADAKLTDVSDSDTSHKEQKIVSSPVDTGLETQGERSSSPVPDKSPEALNHVASDHMEGYEEDANQNGAAVNQTMETAPEHDAVTEGCAEDAKPDDGAAVDQTMEMAPEHDAVTEVVSPAMEAMEVDEGKDLCEDKSMEEAEEKKEADAEADDGNCSGDGGVVGDATPKVTESLVNESDESVISRIHHSPQSTH